MLSVLTINAAIQDVRLLSRSFYRPLGYIDERLPELASQIREINADLVFVQELFHADYQKKIYTLLQSAYPFAAGFDSAGLKFRLGNELLVFSRYPLANGKLNRFSEASLEERLFTSKGMLCTDVTIPGTGKIQLVNFHVTAGGTRLHPEHPRMELVRSKQIQQLLENINHGAPVILAGDLNAGPETSTANYNQLLNAGFIDAFTTTGATGISWDPENPLVAANRESHLPPQRIDHIFVNSAAVKLLNPVAGKVVMSSPGIYTRDRNMIPVSDHYGILVDFKPG